MVQFARWKESSNYWNTLSFKLQPDGNGELYLDTMSATKLALKTFDLGVASVDATFESRIALLKSYANRLHRGLILADVQKKYLVDFLEALDGVLSQED
ncbi:MAG: hypothetical protein NTW50_00905 [Candidatus Berkelbacteria bacterium]|nr:hypothetical protein [Candidatus Berkelbacteria bacterium]